MPAVSVCVLCVKARENQLAWLLSIKVCVCMYSQHTIHNSMHWYNVTVYFYSTYSKCVTMNRNISQNWDISQSFKWLNGYMATVLNQNQYSCQKPVVLCSFVSLCSGTSDISACLCVNPKHTNWKPEEIPTLIRNIRFFCFWRCLESWQCLVLKLNNSITITLTTILARQQVLVVKLPAGTVNTTLVALVIAANATSKALCPLNSSWLTAITEAIGSCSEPYSVAKNVKDVHLSGNWVKQYPVGSISVKNESFSRISLKVIHFPCILLLSFSEAFMIQYFK